MKKSLILLSSAFLFAVSTFAQEEGGVTSKSGAAVLPEAGDWSIAVDASPFFRYVGNFFNNTSNNAAPTWGSYNNPYVITGKYMVDATTAYRGVLGIYKYNEYNTNRIMMAMPQPTPNTFFADSLSFTTDTYRYSSSSIVLGGGYEKRRGHGRLQGSYGGEILFAFDEGSTEKFTYGNALTQNTDVFNPNVDPENPTYTTNWGNNYYNNQIEEVAGIDEGRLLERKTGPAFGIGVRGFIGVEYFFVPKMSIGGEFGWGLGFNRVERVTETWEVEGITADGSEAAAIITDTDSDGWRNSLEIDRSDAHGSAGITSYIRPSGNLRLAFYF